MICGVVTFVVLVVLGMPYAGALALLVAVLDLIPLVGATLGGALPVIVGLFAAAWKAVVLLIYIVVYQQVEGSILQPIVYGHAVQLNGLVIFIAVLVGGVVARHPWRIAGYPGGRDHPNSSYRTSGLPAYETGGEQARRLVPVAAHYLNPASLHLQLTQTKG